MVLLLLSSVTSGMIKHRCVLEFLMPTLSRFLRPPQNRSMSASWLMWFALASPCCLLPQTAFATDKASQTSAKQAAQIQAVVQAQLKAFAADDAALAFSYATPRIRKMFGDADTFLAMVRTSYPVVYRPASTSFFQPEKANGAWVQRVQMSDSQGAVWQATYALELQRNGSWRINGCEVAASNARAA